MMNTPWLGSSTPEDFAKKSFEVAIAIEREAIHIPDRELRNLLGQTFFMIELAPEGVEFGGRKPEEVWHAAVNNCRAWIGAWLRGDPLPEPTSQWKHMS